MASNFDFLKNDWAFLLTEAKRVESNAMADPRTALWAARRTLELALAWVFDNDNSLRLPVKTNLAAFLYEPSFKRLVPHGLYADLKTIHQQGNLATHSAQPIASRDAVQICGALFRFTGWLHRVYVDGDFRPAQFNIGLLPRPQGEVTEETKAQIKQSIVALQDARQKLAEKDQAERQAKDKLQQSQAEIEALKAQIELLNLKKQKNTQQIPEGEYSESQTRDLFIDGMLKEAGWNPKADNVEEFEVRGMPNDKGIGFVDYVLWGADGLPLAVVEAKRTKVDPKEGKHQAKLYADCLENQFGQRPIIFYTNGYNSWIWDDTIYPPREVEGFYTRDELQWRINQRSSKAKLLELKPKPEIAGRYYQMEAAARVMEAFDNQRKRKSLIVMATGTGKTRLSISIVEMLTRGNWSRRVLFLADRKALVRQAKRAFKSLLPNHSVKSLVERDKDDESLDKARIVFSTYPSILNMIDGTKKEQQNTFSVGHFDLIIIDEAHRSVYQKYGAIFDYFDSLLIGLTATPRDEVDRNTYKLFQLDNGQPTFAYELSQAVSDGFLVPPRAVSVPLKFQREGIKYAELSAEEQEEYELEDEFYDEETGELKQEIQAGALNRWLFNEDTVDKVLMDLMQHGLKVDGGDKLGKTILFAKNSRHADFIVERFDQHYPAYAGKFCQKIDYSVKYSQSLIDDFSLINKMPQIAVSVDMLDTGIDVPEVLNLVFFKLVRSRTKFWQMIGRGTRLCEDLYAPGDNKKEFLVFDYCQNFEFFDANPDGYESKAQPSLKQKIFNLKLELAYVLQQAEPDDAQAKELAQSYKDDLNTVVAGLNVDNFIVRKQRPLVEEFSDAKRWEILSEKDVDKLSTRLSNLPTVDSDNQIARRFDLLVHNLQIAILKKSKAQQNYQKTVIELAAGLEDKRTIPLVAEQMELILEIQTEQWWQDVTLPMLENVRLRMRSLIQFVETKQQQDVYTDFEDQILQEDRAEYDLVRSDTAFHDYRVRVEKIIRDNSDHVTVRRLKNNQPISETDIVALQELLFDNEQGLTEQEYQQTFGDRPMGVLVRTVVGLDRGAAKQAFAEFLDSQQFMPDQISFLNEVVEYLVKNGVMEPKEMFDSPFTRFHDQGLVGVMGEEIASKVVELVRKVNNNADVA